MNYGNKILNNFERFPIILDQPISSEEPDQTLLDLVPATYQIEQILDFEPLENQITNPKLYAGFEMLTNQQKVILNYSYVKEINDTTISTLLGLSQQYVSKARKSALKKLKLHLEQEQ
jgi:DNA-directed RNA polymerase specialized sigma subunit